VAGDIVSSNVERAAVLGHCQQSRTELARAAALPRTPTSLLRAGMALALCGAAAQAQALNDEAIKRYPKNTFVNEINLPLIRAALELQRGNRTQAIQLLEPARRYESVSNFYQNYLRAQAYLGERNGAAAASEFQTILDHRGWEPRSPLYPLAHLGLVRAAMLQGDTAKAQKSYQEFFALWKEADADLPVLIEAKKEYEKVK
jgi:eukaryotic-like serine/threonine-protein kinase